MKFLKRLLLLICLVLAVFAWAVYEHPLAVARAIPMLPNITQLPLNTDSPKTVRKGTAQLLVPTADYVPIHTIPLSLGQAVVAIEDRRFYQHKGVDFYGLARAIVNDLSGNNQIEGASTITQQLVRNLYLNQQQTVQRKLTEAFLALQIEDYYKNKDKILDLYLNNVYFGRNAWGIKAAAQAYFGTSDVASLSVEQTAFLAALPQSPSYFASNIDAAMARQRLVIQSMKNLGYLPENFTDVEPKIIP